MKGNVIPVFGIVFVTTAIFKITCIIICPIAPVAISAPNRSLAWVAITKKRQIRIKNSISTNPAPNKPSSSQIMEKIMSFCASGTKPSFWMLSPRPRPNKPPDPMAYNP